MSGVEEDVELRDLLVQTLEKNGSLAKIRAQLRASTYFALEEDINLSKQQPLQNLRVQSYLETPEGRTMFCLVKEFLEFFNLEFTLSVYGSESFLDNAGCYEGRRKLAEDLGLENTEEPTVPLLQQLLKTAQSHKPNVLDINLHLNGNGNVNGKEDDTYEDTSSIIEDSEALEKPLSINISEELKTDVPSANPSSSNSESVVHNMSSKISNSDKPKPSLQRPKASLNTSSHVNDILPSLYNKDFKNKSDTKELDRTFDIDTEYEEGLLLVNET